MGRCPHHTSPELWRQADVSPTLGQTITEAARTFIKPSLFVQKTLQKGGRAWSPSTLRVTRYWSPSTQQSPGTGPGKRQWELVSGCLGLVSRASGYFVSALLEWLGCLAQLKNPFSGEIGRSGWNLSPTVWTLNCLPQGLFMHQKVLKSIHGLEADCAFK